VAGVARTNENVRQAAHLRFSGLARRHYQFPAVRIVWQSQAGVVPKGCVGPELALKSSRFRFGGEKPRADVGAMTAGSDDPWRFI